VLGKENKPFLDATIMEFMLKNTERGNILELIYIL
jgi:hypothetical protein